MKVEIPIVFPNTLHRFCKLHTTHKFLDKIGNVYIDKEAMNELHDFLNNVESTDISIGSGMIGLSRTS